MNQSPPQYTIGSKFRNIVQVNIKFPQISVYGRCIEKPGLSRVTRSSPPVWRNVFVEASAEGGILDTRPSTDILRWDMVSLTAGRPVRSWTSALVMWSCQVIPSRRRRPHWSKADHTVWLNYSNWVSLTSLNASISNVWDCHYILVQHLYTVSKKMHQLWNGIAQNYKDRFWWQLAEIFKIL